MKLVTALELDNQELNDLQTPIIVEMWDKIGGQAACGSKRRAYHKEFNKKERKLISYYHKLFYNWYMVKGTPQKHQFKTMVNIQLIKRAVNFFATV